MNSRKTILDEIRALHIDSAPLPDLADHKGTIEESLEKRFSREVEAAGGQLNVTANRHELTGRLLEICKSAPCWSTAKEIELPHNLAGTAPSRDQLKKLELTVLDAGFGVAENGAVWVPETAMGKRVTPFIARHLAVVLPRESLVENMHLAYKELSGYRQPFGTFISGPSKTADIEQSLVMGAHGPEVFTIFLI